MYSCPLCSFNQAGGQDSLVRVLANEDRRQGGANVPALVKLFHPLELL